MNSDNTKEAKAGEAPYAASMGYSLAMRVLQSELYQRLAPDERAECDEFIRRGQQAKGEQPSVEGLMKLVFELRMAVTAQDLSPSAEQVRKVESLTLAIREAASRLAGQGEQNGCPQCGRVTGHVIGCPNDPM